MTSHPTVLVTGASSGIGLELARIFARDGASLILVATESDRLRAAGVEIGAALCIAQDLCKPGAAESIHSRVRDSGLTVDILINNAGIGRHGGFADADAGLDHDMMTVNMLALVDLTHRFLPAMIERRSGRILNVASLAEFLPGPYMAVYAATKAFVLQFSEALAIETKGTGVTVTALCPGPTATPFMEKSRLDSAMMFQQRLSRVADPVDVAEAGFRAVKLGRRRVFVSRWDWLMVMVSGCLPGPLIGAVLRIVLKPRSRS